MRPGKRLMVIPNDQPVGLSAVPYVAPHTAVTCGDSKCSETSTRCSGVHGYYIVTRPHATVFLMVLCTMLLCQLPYDNVMYGNVRYSIVLAAWRDYTVAVYLWFVLFILLTCSFCSFGTVVKAHQIRGWSCNDTAVHMCRVVLRTKLKTRPKRDAAECGELQKGAIVSVLGEC